jgi:hypothetical protein
LNEQDEDDSGIEGDVEDGNTNAILSEDDDDEHLHPIS